jgi:hypothetical protein
MRGRKSRLPRLAGILALLAVSRLAAETTTIPFPRGGGPVSIGISHGPMLIRSVELKNRPSRHDVRESRTEDPNDTTTLRWVFHVSNGGKRDWKARIRVEVAAADGRLLARDSRSDAVDARTWKDHISVWTKIRTRDYPAASFVKISVEFRPD